MRGCTLIQDCLMLGGCCVVYYVNCMYINRTTLVSSPSSQNLRIQCIPENFEFRPIGLLYKENLGVIIMALNPVQLCFLCAYSIPTDTDQVTVANGHKWVHKLLSLSSLVRQPNHWISAPKWLFRSFHHNKRIETWSEWIYHIPWFQPDKSSNNLTTNAASHIRVDITPHCHTNKASFPVSSGKNFGDLLARSTMNRTSVIFEKGGTSCASDSNRLPRY